VLNFVYGRVSDVRLGELIWGLLPLAGVNPPSKSQHELRALQAVGSWEIPIPWAYAVSKLVCSSNVQLARVFGISQVPVPAELIPRLNSGRVEDASHVAVRRLQASGLSSPFFHLKRIPITPQVEGLRLAASLVFPLSTSDLRHLAIRTGVIAEEKEKEVPVLE
jgi:CRISPR-associated protein Csx17